MSDDNLIARAKVVRRVLSTLYRDIVAGTATEERLVSTVFGVSLIARSEALREGIGRGRALDAELGIAEADALEQEAALIAPEIVAAFAGLEPDADGGG